MFKKWARFVFIPCCCCCYILYLCCCCCCCCCCCGNSGTTWGFIYLRVIHNWRRDVYCDISRPSQFVIVLFTTTSILSSYNLWPLIYDVIFGNPNQCFCLPIFLNHFCFRLKRAYFDRVWHDSIASFHPYFMGLNIITKWLLQLTIIFFFVSLCLLKSINFSLKKNVLHIHCNNSINFGQGYLALQAQFYFYENLSVLFRCVCCAVCVCVFLKIVNFN